MRNFLKQLYDISDPSLVDYTNTLGGNVTLIFPMILGVNAKNTTVGQTMNIKKEYCATTTTTTNSTEMSR